MKKGTKLVALLLGLALMVPACTPGANPSKSSEEPGTSSEAPVNYKVTISNKQELQAEWFVGDQSRKVNLEVEPKANITQLVSEGKITITSSDPAKLTVEGQMASPVAAGEVTITVKCGESEDSVKVTLQAKQTVKEKYGVDHEGTEADPFTNEEACKVAKHEKYNKEDFYVKGKVASFYHAPGSRDDGAVSFYLEPATAGGEKFEVYKCYKDKEQKQKLTDDDIWVGGVVTAHGVFTVYNGTQAETDGSAIFVKCEGNKPQPRQTLTKTFAETLAAGNALADGDSTWDYYKFQGYVTVKEGNNFYLTATKGEALVPGKSDAAHQERDIKGTNAIELYNAGKVAELAAKLLEGAKVEVTMIVKNYHGTVENGLDLKDEDVTVLEAGTQWAVPEPAVANKTVTEFIALENNKKNAYTVKATIKAFKSGDTKDKYGNMTVTDGTSDVAIYGATATATALAWDGAGEYAFTNPQDFLTNETTSALKVGDEITMKLIRADCIKDGVTQAIQGTGIITAVTPAGGEGGGEGGGSGEQTTTRVVDFAAKTAKHNAYNDTWAYGDVTVAGGANNNGGWAFVKMGGKSTTISAEGHPGTWIKTDSATNYSVASITIKYVGKCYNQESEKATVKVESYSDAALATKVAETEAKEVPAITTNEGVEEITYTFTAAQAANLYYKVCFDIINTTTYNGVVALEKITFNAAA